ncbi:MAG: dihydroorotase [Mangrovicoccus sp.]|nr:dihydroorotase [Mangrovicoccus sp.]
MTDTLTIRRPDDWHLHLRDGAVMKAVLPETARHFGRALVMPNLVPPVVTAADAAEYRDRILAAKPDGSKFRPIMTLYLTEDTDPLNLRAAAEMGLIRAVKLYPAGATTNSASGVRDFSKVRRVLETMASIGLPLCVHGEVTHDEVDIFDREKVFIETVLDPIRREIPKLRVVLEHITTAEGVAYVQEQPEGMMGGTITTHHLIIDRNHILVGGIKPHYYCLPVAKRATHRDALVKAATSGDQRFFLGTDSAPHVDEAKESACGCAGVFSATNTMSCLAEVFEKAGALDKLEGFASLHGPAFYKLEPNEDTITLTKGKAVDYPAKIKCKKGPITLFDPGFPLHWRVED